MPSGRRNNFPPSFLLGRAKVVRGFGWSVAISQLRRMIHLAVECNNVPGSQQRGRAQFPFKAESTSLWFWPSFHPHSTQALARTPPTSASFKGNKASHLILKLKSQREQNIFLVLATSCSFGHWRWEITDLAVRTNTRLLPVCYDLVQVYRRPLADLTWLPQIEHSFSSIRFHQD